MTSGSTSPISSSRPLLRSSLRWRTTAGMIIVRAIELAVSDSMLRFTEYCSVNTSRRASSSRLDSTLYFLNAARVDLSTSHGSASGVVGRLARPRFSASLCHASE